MTRMRLGNRHEADIVKIQSRVLNGTSLFIKTSPLPHTGTLGEVFISGAKTGSHIDSLCREFATVLSIALQYGMSLRELAENIQREPDGKPCSVFGEVVDVLVADAKAAT